MAAITAGDAGSATAERNLRWGSWLMGAAAVGFIGYAVIFFIRNFTDSFLELGIGPGQVNVGKDQIQAFSPSLYHYIGHLQIAVSGFIAATGIAVVFLVARRAPRSDVGVGRRGGRSGRGVGGGAPGPLPVSPRHDRAPRADLLRDHHLPRGGSRVPARDQGSEGQLSSHTEGVERWHKQRHQRAARDAGKRPTAGSVRSAAPSPTNTTRTTCTPDPIGTAP